MTKNLLFRLSRVSAWKHNEDSLIPGEMPWNLSRLVAWPQLSQHKPIAMAMAPSGNHSDATCLSAVHMFVHICLACTLTSKAMHTSSRQLCRHRLRRQWVRRASYCVDVLRLCANLVRKYAAAYSLCEITSVEEKLFHLESLEGNIVMSGSAQNHGLVFVPCSKTH